MFSCNSQFIWSGSYTQLLTVKQLEIQAESKRLLANARSVLEIESSLTFSRPEWAKTNQSASFQLLEHATVPVRATKFAEVETGLNRAMICINVSNFFTYFQKIGRSTWTQRSKFGRLIRHFGRTLTARVRCGRNNKQSVCVIRNTYVK